MLLLKFDCYQGRTAATLLYKASQYNQDSDVFRDFFVYKGVLNIFSIKHSVFSLSYSILSAAFFIIKIIKTNADQTKQSFNV